MDRATRLDAWVINRDRDAGRRERFFAQDQHGLAVRRFRAVDGHAAEFALHAVDGLPARGMWDAGWIKPGAIGCFLSHAALWRRIASSGRPALILEDDAVLIGGIGDAARTCARSGADLLFVNARTASWLPPGETGAPALIEAAARRIAPGWPGPEDHPGTDGYL